MANFQTLIRNAEQAEQAYLDAKRQHGDNAPQTQAALQCMREAQREANAEGFHRADMGTL